MPENGLDRPVTTKEEMEKAARGRFGTVDDAMQMLTLQFLSHLHALLGSNSLQTLSDDSFLRWNAVKHLKLLGRALPFVLASLLHKARRPLRIE